MISEFATIKQLFPKPIDLLNDIMISLGYSISDLLMIVSIDRCILIYDDEWDCFVSCSLKAFSYITPEIREQGSVVIVIIYKTDLSGFVTNVVFINHGV